MNKALVLFSGGQDSTTCLQWAINRYEQVVAFSTRYGQRHSIELFQAAKICWDLKTERVELELPHTLLPPGAGPVVEGRNMLFLTLAATTAKSRGIRDIVAGFCGTDDAGFPDCRQEFVDAAAKALTLALDWEIRVHTPLMRLTKAETFALAAAEGILDCVIEDSHTCYVGDRQTRHAWGAGCGECAACKQRAAGWANFTRTA